MRSRVGLGRQPSASSRQRQLSAISGIIIALALSAAPGSAAVRSTPAAGPLSARFAKADTAYFAGGCFWGIEAVFEHTRGVTSAVSGYAGGNTVKPSYEEVSTGETGHAESVKVIYDPSVVSYRELLEVFFKVAHDPTQLNRQGPDHGTQYRSAIFFRSPEQKAAADAYVAELTKAKAYHSPIVTQIVPFKAFYDAEGYHQGYLASHMTQPYIVYNDLPKLEALKNELPQLYRGQQVLMLLYLLAFFGGVLTIVSPCILPVLPLVFARANEPFRKSGLPLLLGMAATFALVAGVATYAGSWVVRANQVGRVVAMVVFAILGLALLFPRLATYLTTPLVRLGARFQTVGSAESRSVGSSVLLGVSTGLLWAPCAGPILGLILTGAAVSGPSLNTGFLLLAFSLGAAVSLALALLAGGRVFSLMKRSLGAEEWIRRGLGVAVLLGVVAIATGLDTGILRKLSLATTSGIEQKLIDQVTPGTTSTTLAAKMPGEPKLSDEGPFPGFAGGGTWFNSPALSKESLAGKVVLIDFWTYSCINCLRAIPYVQAWEQKYRDQGLLVIGVHTPEFAFERDSGNVVDAIKDLKIGYPVVMDNDYAIWKAFKNNYWPAHFFIDAKGTIRHHRFGEGGYAESEMVIRELLKANGTLVDEGAPVTVAASGAMASADFKNVKSPETYLGYARAKNNVSTGPVVRNAPQQYSVPRQLDVNQWGLSGSWKVSGENAQLIQSGGKVVFRFHARDLHLVLGPSVAGKPIRFKVTIDGAEPGTDAGMDVDATGAGMVSTNRLYQLVRQSGPVKDRTFEIEFLDPGVQAFAFTFG